MTREGWESLAWLLWRRGHRTYGEISAHLALEGWAVPPGRVSDVVMERVAEDLQRSLGRGRRLDAGPHTPPGAR